MKWVWVVLGVVVIGCCGILSVMIGGGYFLAKQGVENTAQAQEFGDRALREIAENWEANVLIDNAAKEMRDQNPYNVFVTTTQELKDLGKLKSVESSIKGIEARSTTESGSYVICQYEGGAVFDKGKGQVLMSLMKRGDKWGILKFNIRRDPK